MSKKLYCKNDECDMMGWDVGGCSPHDHMCPTCKKPGVLIGYLSDRQTMVVCCTELINAIQEEGQKIYDAVWNSA